MEMTRVALRSAVPEDAGWIVERHAALYAQEACFDDSFRAVVRGVLDRFFAGASGRGWIAEQDGAPAGCIFCMMEEPGWARLRLFLLEPEARGTGMGRRLLETCMAFARENGAGAMRLSTHESHEAACALYAKVGWIRVASRPVQSYGCDLVEQDWEILFAP
ncbi:GNAT family N-acetyltransferase [Aestuariibius insulae]|uniref:GNAT family N-acetyltransferase n=1 Tax=Aestuariibius insulae TaxID=2058287 RepID=UPI00345E87A5